MKIERVELAPLEGKYYETSIYVDVSDETGYYTFCVDVTGYYPKPSQREVDNGWEPDYGMDHAEPKACHRIAEMIVDCLLDKTQEKI